MNDAYDQLFQDRELYRLAYYDDIVDVSRKARQDVKYVDALKMFEELTGRKRVAIFDLSTRAFGYRAFFNSIIEYMSDNYEVLVFVRGDERIVAIYDPRGLVKF